MDSSNKTGKILPLDGMRFIAILIIILSRLEFFEKGLAGGIYTRYLHNAQPAVDYFFMLSGFGMMLGYVKRHTADEGKLSPRLSLQFALRHVQRIYPIYFLFLLVGIPYQIASTLQFHGFGHAVMVSAFELLLSMLMIQSATGVQQFSHAFNGPSWFLSSLFVIYLFSPLLMRLIHRHFNTMKRIAVGLIANMVIVILISGLFSAIEMRMRFDDLNYSSPWKRVFYVVFGMLIAMLYLHTRDSIKVRHANRLCWLSIILACVWFLSRNTFAPLLSIGVYGIDFFVCGFMLYTLTIARNGFTHFLSRHWIVWLGGQLSMYLYMSHYLIRMYLDQAFVHFGLTNLPMRFMETSLILVLSFAISYGLLRIQGAVSGKHKRAYPQHKSK